MLWFKKKIKNNNEKSREFEKEFEKIFGLPCFKKMETYYTCSHESLDPGYEEVYKPFFTLTVDGDLSECLVLARFLWEGDGGSAEEAALDFLKVVKNIKSQKRRVYYKRYEIEYLSQEERNIFDKLEELIREVDYI